MDARELRIDLEEQLVQMRKSWLFFKKNKGVKDRIKHMATLKKIGIELKSKLEEVPAIYTLFEYRNLPASETGESREQELLDTLSLLIVGVVEYHHTSEMMSVPMVKEVALRIVYQFGGLTIEDIGLCFHQIKNGQRGKVYNRIDAAVIMQWLHDYQAELQEIGTERNARLHNQSKTGVWKDGHEHRIIQPKRLKDLT